MRLISCKKCGAKVSNQYSHCTNCQAPLSAKDLEESEAEAIQPKSKKTATVERPLLVTILRQSLTSYTSNLPLLVPVAVSIITTIVTGFVVNGALQQLQSLSSAQTIAEATKVADILFGILPFVLVLAFANFLVNLGLIAMVGRIVTKHKCKLSDWAIGIKNYFWRIFNISIVITLLFGFVSAVPVSVLSQGPRIFAVSIGVLLTSLGQLVCFFCYAAVMIDDANLQSSINLSTRAIRASGRDFLDLFALYFIALDVKTILGTADPFAIGFPSGLSSLSNLAIIMNIQNIVYAIFLSLLSPLWLLVSFTMYRKEKPRK